MVFDIDFYRERRVFITGHTGFKGSWMVRLLQLAGAHIMGYALSPPTVPSLFELLNLEESIESIDGDVRDLGELTAVMTRFEPEVVIHMAAQPIVRQSYIDPVYTYETNVMGTVNILEAVRQSRSVKSFVNVTTDKVYKNREWPWGYRENDELNGYDPYSNSKSCADIITDSFRQSFFQERGVAISTVRAGNVIGGGDFATDRIVPDCVRAAERGAPVVLRNPNSIRPYQHVLEPVTAYLLLAQKQLDHPQLYSGSYNIGPNESDCVTTGYLASLFCDCWGDGITVQCSDPGTGPHEANFLKLDISRIGCMLDWKPKWDVATAIEKTVEWEKIRLSGGNVDSCMVKQIREYLQL